MNRQSPVCLNQLAGPIGLTVILLICSSTGCRWPGMCGGPCGPYAGPAVDAACDRCGDACGGHCGAEYGAACGRFPASCGNSGGCGGYGCLGFPWLASGTACGSGCGDVFWGEWIFNPPECCDSCNENGCWAGSDCDGSYAPYRDRYEPGCGNGYGYGSTYGCGLLVGPAAILHGTYLGVTNVVRGTFGLLRCGYGRLVCGYGPGYGYSAGDSYGYGDGDGDGYGASECDNCGTVGCNDCTADASTLERGAIAARPLGSGVRTASRVTRNRGAGNPAIPPTQLRLNQRLRR